jgi:5-carboxymethyl-2-hydroxymuconate isomerase
MVCVGRNYAAHAEELGNEIPAFPLIFLKPPSAAIPSGGVIIYPDYSNDMHHEIELLLLIGKTVKNASLEEAEEAIVAYGVGLDMTLRDVQNELKQKGHPWTLAKCFDTSAVISDFISKEDYKLTQNEIISLKVNDEIRQSSPLSLMLFNPAEVVKCLSEKMTLEKGDIIFTGTPKGVSKVEKGDSLYGEIENIASLTAKIV